MGLAVQVGSLAYYLANDSEGAESTRRSVALVNRVLGAKSIPAFVEAGQMPVTKRQGISSYPYSFIHYLRRAYALARQGLPVPPIDELSEADDFLIDEESQLFDSHLLCHSDCDGYYVPVDFAEPIFSDEVPGDMLGSSYGLRRELLDVAPALGIELANQNPTPAAIQRLVECEDGAPLFREHIVWLCLWEATRISIGHSTMIVFC